MELDGYAGAERVYFIVSEDPIQADAIGLPEGVPLIEADRLDLPGLQRSILLTGAP